MKTTEEIIEILQNNKDTIKRKYKLNKLGLFGEYSTGKQTKDSYVDIMVEFKGSVGLEYVDLETELEQILGEKVHLITKSGVDSKYLKNLRKDIIYF